MGRDLKAILGELGGNKAKALFDDKLMRAKNGDWSAVVYIANKLRRNAEKKRDLVIAKELYECLVAEGEDQYTVYVIEVEHLLNPSSRYSEEEVQMLVDHCCQGQQEFGFMVKAIQSATPYFQRFKSKAVETYHFLANKWYDEDQELRCWYLALVLDPRMESEKSVVQDALSELSECFEVCTDPYIAKCYLDAVVLRHQRFQEDWPMDEALECLVKANKLEDYYFYKGVRALCVANYDLAYRSFGKNCDKRNRLAQAYCLIHGMGTTVNHSVAQDILKDYPDDSFALYLYAVSLFRTADHPKELPAEVDRLLAESLRLGYGPAENTRYQMEALCCLYSSNLIKLAELIDQLNIRALKESDAAAYGTYCCVLYQLCINKVLQGLEKEDAHATPSLKTCRMLLDGNHTKRVINGKVPEVTPLAAFSRGLFFSRVERYSAGDYWAEGIRGFNQSPVLRKWGMQKALVDYLFEGKGDHMDEVFRLYLNMGGNEKDMLLWHVAIDIFSQHENTEFKDSLIDGFLGLIGKENKNHLCSLLKARFYLERKNNREDGTELRKLLEETANVNSPLLICLRNRITKEARLEKKIPLNLSNYLVNEVNEDLLVYSMGYAFFDYNL